jgi:hypothetical protein
MLAAPPISSKKKKVVEKRKEPDNINRQADSMFKRRETKSRHYALEGLNKSAPATVAATRPVEYSIYKCPHCASTRCTVIGGNISRGDTHKAETWGRKDNDGDNKRISCEDCGKRWEEGV